MRLCVPGTVNRTCLLLALAVVAVAQPTASGVRPRSSAADYAASAAAEGVTYGVTQLSPDQVKHLFASDISKAYLVLEVGCYPSTQANAVVSPSDFLIKTGVKGEFAHPADASTVASVVVPQKNSPRDGHPPAVTPTGGVGVGIASETDPTTGRKVHTVYTEADAGVSVGQPVGQPYPTPYPASDGSRDRATLQNQLADRELPEGQFVMPVAGYLYFPAAYVKKHSGTSYELEYMTPSGAKVSLTVPISK